MLELALRSDQLLGYPFAVPVELLPLLIDEANRRVTALPPLVERQQLDRRALESAGGA
jgi:hypothetical protein